MNDEIGAIEKALRESEHGLTLADLEKKTGIKRRILDRRLKFLVKLGDVRCLDEHRMTQPFRYVLIRR